MAMPNDEASDLEFLMAGCEVVQHRTPHESHGHPPLDAGSDYWMKWDEWQPNLLQRHQSHQLEVFRVLVRPRIEWFYEKDAVARGPVELLHHTFPEKPTDDASYDEKQEYLRSCFKTALDIALPQRLEPKIGKSALRQTSLDVYRSLYLRCGLKNPSTSTRLLDILPGESNDPLVKTRLFVTPLDGIKSSYDALSYAWGDMTNTQNLPYIQINGLAQRVTRNVYDALRALRLREEDRTIWIDSICISQGDIRERGQQVAIMSKIYAHAEKTIIYLGRSSPSVRALFTFLRLPICAEGLCEHCDQTHFLHSWPGSPVLACRKAGLNVQDVLDGFVDVCSRDWWNRIWILQEYTLSKQDPIFYCGSDALENSLLEGSFPKLYDWAFHNKRHATPVQTCNHYACQDTLKMEDDDMAIRQVAELMEAPTFHTENQQFEGLHGEETANISKSQDTMHDGRSNTDTRSVHSSNENDIKRGNIVSLERTCLSQEWKLWGEKVRKAYTVLSRRASCRPWHEPYYIYKSLQGQCSDPHDIIYGLLELTEPLFKDIFVPDYTVPIPQLYTKAAAYMIIFHYWNDIFWHYPHKLSHTIEPKNLRRGIPSWTPDFTKPTKHQEAERTPSDRHGGTLRSALDAPQIVDRILFMKGWLVDEVVTVYPFPENNPYKVLQQLWYIERLGGRAPYRLIDGTLADEAKRLDDLQETIKNDGFIDAYPSIAWATRYAETTPSNISILHVISQVASFDNITEVVEQCLQLVGLCVDHQLEREGTPMEASAPHDIQKEHRHREIAMFHRLTTLLDNLLDEMWIDFIGICTFDFEGLRAQVRHRSTIVSEWRPTDPSDNKSNHKDDPNLCRPGLVSAVFQQPMQYLPLLRDIVQGIDTEEEVQLRKDAVMLLAAAVRQATTWVVGGQRRVHYIDLELETVLLGRNLREAGRTRYECLQLPADGISEGEKYAVHEVAMVPISADITTGSAEDGCDFTFWYENNDEQDMDPSLRRILQDDRKVFIAREKECPSLPIITEENEDAHSGETSVSSPVNEHRPEVEGSKNDKDINSSNTDAGAELSDLNDIQNGQDQSQHSALNSKTTHKSEDDLSVRIKGQNDAVVVFGDEEDAKAETTHATMEPSRKGKQTPNFEQARSEFKNTIVLFAEPSPGRDLWWRLEAVPNDPSPPPVSHFLKNVVEFLSGREMFFTATGLEGLTGPGTHGVCDGDDVFILNDMSFPLIGRLEPSPLLGNPKARRWDYNTIRMRREIIGTAVVRGIDASGGPNLEEVAWPKDFKPFSSEGHFRFK